MKKIAAIGSIWVIGYFLLAGCKKSDSPPPEKLRRIRAITGTTETKTFLYDNEDRVTRINSSAGYSTRFTYSPTEIIVQDYFSNDQPDPQGKYSFTVENGRVASGRKYLSNGAVVHEYGYQYDGQQRLAAISFIIKDFTGSDAENHYYQLSYDAQDNLQQITFKRSLEGEDADSSSVTITWYTDKSFLTWKNMGFDVFGKIPVGHKVQGQVAIPFSLADNIYPAKNAIKLVDTKNYRWNPATGAWRFSSSQSGTRPETDYQYNVPGWLTKYLNYTIEWDN